MGWYDAFKGDTARVNLSGVTGGSAAKNFGDAFASIGKTMVDADAQTSKNKLIDMQLQNEQLKMDDAANNRADKNTQEYASTMTRDAWGKDKATSLSSLDATATPEATLNAQQAVNAFYTPTKEMKADWTGQEKVVQDTNNKSYLSGAFNLDPTLSKDARKVEDDKLRGLYKPEITQLSEIEKRFKEQDVVAQVKFNDEGVGVSVSGGFKDYNTFVKNNPDIVKNIDGATEKSIKLYFDDMSKAKNDKDREDAKQGLEARKVAVQEGTLKQSKYEWDHPHATKGGEGSSSQEKDSKVVDAINKTMTTRYGKVDANGNPYIDDKNQVRATWVGTRAMYHAAQGKDASTATSLAERDYNFESKKTAGAVKKESNRLNLPDAPK